MTVPPIDHLVIDVTDRIDEAARRYAALGFQLTPRSHHSLGSANHLCMFASDYLELLSPGDGKRPDLAGFPVGLNGLVFALHGADALYERLRAKGVPAQPVQRFSRPVDLAGGERKDVRFNVVRLGPRSVFDGRVYFCEHLTPELVWRPEWQSHPNGALELARVAFASSDPDRLASAFGDLFGAGATTRNTAPGARYVLRAKEVAIEIWLQRDLAAALGSLMPDPAGRADHMALLGVRVRSLQRAEATLRTSGVRFVRRDGRVLVPPAETMNVTLEFVE